MIYNENNEETTIKQAAIQFDVFLKEAGIGAALFFMFIILLIVNAHSLHFLFGDGIANWVWAGFGSISFSLATMVVIRKPVSSWMKFVFPVFDMILVFLGFNLVSDFMDVHFWMTVFFALFTGAILISLGTINFKENIKVEKDDEIKKAFDAELEKLKNQHEQEMNQLKSTANDLNNENEKLNAGNVKLNQVIEQLNHDQTQLIQHSNDLNESYEKLVSTSNDFEKESFVLKAQFDKLKKSENMLKDETGKLKKENINLKENVSEMIASYVIRESIRSKKRINGNRTAKDDAIEALADRIKAGETIEVNEFISVNN